MRSQLFATARPVRTPSTRSATPTLNSSFEGVESLEEVSPFVLEEEESLPGVFVVGAIEVAPQ